jgi:hypothetical protein
MKEDGFASDGGRYADWLKAALRNGVLSPAEVQRRAASIVGQETVERWNPPEG